MPQGQYLGAGSAITQGLYRLEDVNDSSGNSRTLTNNGSTTFTAAQFSNGANFGSANTTKWLNIANAMGVDGNAVTISGWTQILAAPGSGVIFTLVSQFNTTSKIFYLIQYINSSGTLQVQCLRAGNGGGSTGGTVTVTKTLTVNTWYHIAMTYDNTNVVVYLNGASIGSAAGSGNGITAGTNSFAIGGRNAAPQQLASCVMDEVLIENRAWSAQTMQKYYTFAKGRYGVI